MQDSCNFSTELLGSTITVVKIISASALGLILLGHSFWIEIRRTWPKLRTLCRSTLSLWRSDSSLVSILRSCDDARCSEGSSAGWEQIMSSRKSIAMFFSAGLLSKSYKSSISHYENVTVKVPVCNPSFLWTREAKKTNTKDKNQRLSILTMLVRICRYCMWLISILQQKRDWKKLTKNKNVIFSNIRRILKGIFCHGSRHVFCKSPKRT